MATNDETAMAQDVVGRVQDAESQDREQEEPHNGADTDNAPSPNPLKRDAEAAELPPMSKNQMKKLRKKEKWEGARESRKVKRKEKMQEKRARRRKDHEEKHAQGGDADAQEQETKPQYRPTQLPITFIFDCNFDDLMNDRERVSLATQLTRSHSDNRKSRFRAHLALSSFGGKLKERFEGILDSHHRKWHGVRFLEEDFVKTAELAKEWMKAEGGGQLAGALAKQLPKEKGEEDGGKQEQAQTTKQPQEEEGEVIYLSSDSQDTLTELKPNSTYIIGALVDKNRHKGICYKRATEAGIKTAKLPIGDYMDMSSRKVLTTNHVNEIMLKWLELGDWGEAFIQVIPKRKGGALKGQKDVEDEELAEGAPDGEFDEEVQTDEQDAERKAEVEDNDLVQTTQEP